MAGRGPVKRKVVRAGVLAGVAGGIFGLMGGCLHPAPSPVSVPSDVANVTTRSFGDLRVHVINTGWVRVKQRHRELDGPSALRFPAIVTGREWTELMPVLVGVIEHPEGIFVVDTGLSEAMLDPRHFDCDTPTRLVYKHLLDFRFEPVQRLDRQLARLGLDPSAVKAVVMTHRHADHTEGFAHLPSSVTAYVGEGDWPTHNGALPCRWPTGRVPVLVASDEGPPLQSFPHARALTRDGRVAIVPLTGHSPGHLGVVIATDDGSVVFGGDAAFDVTQIRDRRIAGIVEDPGNARASLDVLAAQIGSHRTWLVLAHDPVLLRRFGDGLATTLDVARSNR